VTTLPAGDVARATVMLTSVQGFTARAETMPPADVAAWANAVHAPVTEAVVRSGGAPVKYLGDGLLALFAGDDPTARAIQAALVARDTVADPLVVALVEGPVHVAPIGHGAHARPDLLGATVNRAFRLLGWASASAAGRIALAPDGEPALDESLEIVNHPAVTLKGIAAPIRVLEVSRSEKREQPIRRIVRR
jgi:adenylate cyclase